MKPLKTAVRQHLEQQQLSPAQLARLAAWQQKRAMGPWLLALVASVALFSLVLLRQQDHQGQMVQAIAQEVAKNHIKMKPLEIQSSQLTELQHYFTELAFSPVQSQLWQPQGQLQGGRYCSIQGEDAAQLRFRGQQGRLLSLYQAPFEPTRHQHLPRAEWGQKPLERYADGVLVRIWVEKDLLMVSAQRDPGQ